LRYLEMFRSSYFADLSLNQWMALTTPALVRIHFNLDHATMAARRKDKPVIVAGHIRETHCDKDVYRRYQFQRTTAGPLIHTAGLVIDEPILTDTVGEVCASCCVPAAAASRYPKAADSAASAALPASSRREVLWALVSTTQSITERCLLNWARSASAATCSKTTTGGTGDPRCACISVSCFGSR
jgi:hypothetical protein